MKYHMFFVIFLLATTNFAQTGLLTGKVIDASTKEALIGANILVTELENVGAATDVNGNFRISIPMALILSEYR